MLQSTRLVTADTAVPSYTVAVKSRLSTISFLRRISKHCGHVGLNGQKAYAFYGHIERWRMGGGFCHGCVVNYVRGWSW